MSTRGCHLVLLIAPPKISNFYIGQHKDHPFNICFKLIYWFQNFFYTFPIVSYGKTMSADGQHIECKFWLANIILKVHHAKIIQALFALNRFSGFRWKKLNIFPLFYNYVRWWQSCWISDRHKNITLVEIHRKFETAAKF